MKRCGVFRLSACIIVCGGAFLAQAQPSINPPNGNPPGVQAIAPGGRVPAITAGSFVPNGFILLINGSFNPQNSVTVSWTNPTLNQSASLPINSNTSTQISVTVPPDLIPSSATAPEPVTITVTESNVSSQFPPATATFTINPAMALPPNGAILTPGTIGVPYSQPLLQFGTGPYTFQLQNSTVFPPGLTPTTTGFLAGTPNQTGTYTWNVQITDAWNNVVAFDEGTEIVAVPTLSLPLNPSSAPAGNQGVVVSVTGSNFVPTQTVLGNQIQGTTAVWIPTGGSISTGTALATSVTNSGLLTATIPDYLMFVPGVAQIAVVQPSGATSLTTLPFTVVPPAITSLSPPSLTARPTPVTLTVNGSAFTSDPMNNPGISTILLNGNLVATNLLSPTSLSTSQIFNTPGTIAVEVENPGGALSNIVNLVVYAPPTLTAASPAFATVGQGFLLTLTGANFNPTQQISFGGTLLNTNYVSPTTLTATVPASLLTSAATVPLTVVTQDAFSPAPLSFGIYPVLQITTASLPAATYNQPYAALLLAIGGRPPYTWSATNLQGLTINPATGDIRGATTSLTNFTINATVTDANGTVVTVPLTIAVTVSKPAILTASLPAATYNGAYFAQVSATGGTPPYTWSATGLLGPSINRTAGVISGIVTTPNNMNVSVTVTDANSFSATASFVIIVTVPTPPLQLTGGSLPGGQVGVPYSGAVVSATGGAGNYTYSAVGSMPPGLTLSSGGAIGGTPTAYGTFSFSVQVSDGSNTTSAGYTIQIKPAPVTITGPSTTSTMVVGSTVSIKFGAAGGIPPYSFNISGNTPDGASFGRDAVMSGTAKTAGTYTFTVYATDSQGTQGSKSFTIIVTGPLLSITASLGDGQVGVAYSGRAGASGGQSPYTVTVTGLPDGLSYSNGVISGTPTTAGTYTVKVSSTDAAGTQVSQSFTITIAPAALTITGTLGNSTVGVAYTGSVSATGGAPPYTFAFSGLPAGLTGSSSGGLTGTPGTAGPFSIGVTVTDSKGATASKTFTGTIAPPPLTITSASVSNATVGSAVSATFTASGGVPPYTWSSSGLPAGLTLSTAGALSGSPTAPGTPSFTATVTDSAGTTASRTVTLTVALPPTPPVNLTGLPATSNPATQSTLQIGIANAYPVDVTVALTLTFAADSGPDDPTVQFATGGRTATLMIPAGSLVALSNIGVQTGTVAGTATITARLTAASQDITPSPAPTRTVRINAAAPVETTVTATISGNSFTVTIVGYATTRSITSATFTFTPAPGATLQTTSVTIPVDQLFVNWYSSAASAAFGSQFTFSQTFNVTGGVSSIASVSVILVNANGTSTAVSATLK